MLIPTNAMVTSLLLGELDSVAPFRNER